LRSAGAPPLCGRGVADPIEIRSSSTCVILLNLVVLGQTLQALLRRSPKNITLASRLSRSLKVIGTDTDRSATCFLLTFHSNHEVISYSFRDKRRFQSKSANFSHPCICTPLKGFPLEWGTTLGVKKLK